MVEVRFTWSGGPPDSIHNRLAARLGREPTRAEDAAEIRRVLEDGLIAQAEAGKLPHQRRRR